MDDIVQKKGYKYNRNQKKKLRKKESKLQRKDEIKLQEHDPPEVTLYPSKLDNVEEFVLKDGFERFNMDLDSENAEKNAIQQLKLNEDLPRKAITAAIIESNHTKDEFDDGEKMSKKRWKKLNRMSLGDLKLKVKKPDLVEPWDNCSKDPVFLLELKAKRNTVPVPRHWCATGKYLQSKRGFVKPPFKLPEFIAKTGIMEMRQTADDKEAEKSLKAKMKDKIRPKVGLVDISYEKYYNAFFVEQTKPDLTRFGDIYYQGKELEGRRREYRPGVLSDDLRVALGLPTGSNADKIPPPWLISQQRYGPPPSYPYLKIPGLNAGIPNGCSFGYDIGCWGKPPVDDDGKPLYGDVFANAFTSAPVLIDIDAEEDEDKYWGEIESNGDDSDQENEDDRSSECEEDEPELPAAPKVEVIVKTEQITSHKITPTEIRKKTDESASTSKVTSDEKKSFGHIIQEVKSNIGSNIMGSDKIYALSGNDSKIQLQKRKNESQDKTETKVKKHKEFKF